MLAAAAIVAVWCVGTLLVKPDGADRFTVNASNVPWRRHRCAGRTVGLAFVIEDDLFLADGPSGRMHRITDTAAARKWQLSSSHDENEVAFSIHDERACRWRTTASASPPQRAGRPRSPGRRRRTTSCPRPPTRCAWPRSTARRVRCRHEQHLSRTPAVVRPLPAVGGVAERDGERHRHVARPPDCRWRGDWPGRHVAGPPTTWCWSRHASHACPGDPVRREQAQVQVLRFHPVDRRRETGRLSRSLRPWSRMAVRSGGGPHARPPTQDRRFVHQVQQRHGDYRV